MQFGLRVRPSRVMAAGVVVFAVVRVASLSMHPTPFLFDSDRTYTVDAILGGDTLLLERDVQVRLLGVQSEQPDHGIGNEARDFTKQFVGQESVRLHFERIRQDERKQVLAYVFVGDRCLNEELLRAGLGRVSADTDVSSDMKKRFIEAENEAKSTGRGLWSDDKQPDNRSGCRFPAKRSICRACPTNEPRPPRTLQIWRGQGPRARFRPSPSLRPAGESRAACDRPRNRCHAGAT